MWMIICSICFLGFGWWLGLIIYSPVANMFSNLKILILGHISTPISVSCNHNYGEALNAYLDTCFYPACLNLQRCTFGAGQGFGDLIKFIGILQLKNCLVLYTNVFGYDKENRTRVPILLYRLLLRELREDPKVQGGRHRQHCLPLR
jgi:hypothetical protein